MKKIILILLIIPGICSAATRNIVPRANDEGNIGLSTITWHGVYASKFYGDGSSLTGTPGHVLDLSTYAVRSEVSASTAAIISSFVGVRYSTDPIAGNLINGTTYTQYVDGRFVGVRYSTDSISGNLINGTTYTQYVDGRLVGVRYSTDSVSGDLINGTTYTQYVDGRMVGVRYSTDTIAGNLIDGTTYTTAINSKVSKAGDTMTGPLVLQKNAYPLLTLDNAAGGYYAYLDGATWDTYGPTSFDINAVSGNDVTIGRRLNVSSAVASVGFYGPGTGLTNVPGNAIDGSTYTYRIDGLAAALSTAAYLPNSNVFTGTNNTFASVTASSLSVTGDIYVSSKLAVNMYPDGSHALDVGGAIHSTAQAIIGGTMTVQGNAFSVGGSTLVVSGGQVGIGAAPFAPLSIKSLGAVTAFSINASDNANIFYISEGGDGRGYMAVRDTSAGIKIFLDSNGPSYFTGGNVGIGTTGPASKLHMSSGVYINDGNSYGLFVGTTTTTKAAMRIVSRSGDEYVAKFSSSTGDASFGIHPNGHFSVYGTTASLATCANATMSANSRRDSAFTVNFTGANSSCGINFGEAFDVQPVCVAITKNAGNNGVEMSQVSVSSVTFRPMVGAYAAGDMMNVICVGAH